MTPEVFLPIGMAILITQDSDNLLERIIVTESPRSCMEVYMDMPYVTADEMTDHEIMTEFQHRLEREGKRYLLSETA